MNAKKCLHCDKAIDPANHTVRAGFLFCASACDLGHNGAPDFDPGCCPFCQSSDITGEAIDIDGNQAKQECSCTLCGTAWLDIYTHTVAQMHAEPEPDSRPWERAGCANVALVSCAVCRRPVENSAAVRVPQNPEVIRCGRGRFEELNRVDLACSDQCARELLVVRRQS